MYRVDRKLVDGGIEHIANPLILQPNSEQGCQDFVETLVTNLQVSGNAYVLRERGRSGAIVALKLLRSDRVTVNIAESGAVADYTYEINGKNYSIPAGDCAHLKLPNPADDVYGLSPILVCSRFLNLDISISEFLRAFYANAGVPAGILKLKRRISSQDEADVVRNRWRSSFSGSGGWHALAVLDEDASYEQVAPAIKDMDTSSLTKVTETRIAATFGVPPILLGLQAGLETASYSNYQQARESFVAETVSPLLSKISQFLTRALELDSDQYVYADTNGIKMFTEDVTVSSDRVVRQWDAGIITLNEARTALGYEDIEDGGRRRVPMNILEIGTDDKDLEELASGATNFKVLGAGIPAADFLLDGPRALPRAGRLSRALDRDREELTDELKRDLEKYFKKLRSTVAGTMGRYMERGSGDAGFTKTLPLPAEILPPNGALGLADVIRNGYWMMIQRTWTTIAASGVAGVLEFDPKLPLVNQYLGFAAVASGEMWSATERAIALAVELALERGYTIEDLVQGVPDEDFPGINSLVEETYQGRAETIARTEMSRAQNQSTLSYYKEQDIEFVQAIDPDGDPKDTFIAAGDGLTCAQRHEQIYSVIEAGSVESHPNCKLKWMPVSTEDVETEEMQGGKSAGLSRSTDAGNRSSVATVTKVAVPVYMKANAQRGILYVEEGRGGSGLTDKTINEAYGLAKGVVTDDKVLRMGPWFARHLTDLQRAANSNPESEDWPGAGAVAWLLWGGNPLQPEQSIKWADRQARIIREGENY